MQAIWNLLLIFFLHTIAKTEYDGIFFGFLSFMYNLLNDGHIQCNMRQLGHICREQTYLFNLKFATGNISRSSFYLKKLLCRNINYYKYYFSKSMLYFWNIIRNRKFTFRVLCIPPYPFHSLLSIRIWSASLHLTAAVCYR